MLLYSGQRGRNRIAAAGFPTISGADPKLRPRLNICFPVVSAVTHQGVIAGALQARRNVAGLDYLHPHPRQPSPITKTGHRALLPAWQGTQQWTQYRGNTDKDDEVDHDYVVRILGPQGKPSSTWGAILTGYLLWHMKKFWWQLISAGPPVTCWQLPKN
jgi:hypothetical protein